MSIFKRTQRKYVKKAYRVRNWREYEAGLRNRGSLTVWISLTAGKLVNWDAPRPRRRKPGRQRKYSNHAIETVGGTESRGKDRVQDSEHHDGARDA